MIIKMNAPTLAMIAQIVLLSSRDELIVDVAMFVGKLRIVMKIFVDRSKINDEQFC